MHNTILRIGKIFRKLCLLLGIVFSVLLALGFSEQPFWAYHRLSCPESNVSFQPTAIVMMGAEGMPSEKNLIRCYYTCEAAHRFPESKIIVALPHKPEDRMVDKNVRAIIDEFTSKKIDSSRITFEPLGINTYTQVQQISKMISLQDSVLVVTSPEHIKRTLLCFHKMNIKQVTGRASFESDLKPEILRSKSEGRKVKESLNLRYNIWSQYQYEIIVAREYLALLYYRFKGYI